MTAASPITGRAAEAFARFMAAYPPRRPNPSAPARAEFAKLLKEGLDADQLVAAAGRFARLCKAEGVTAQFVPHARRWLKNREFEDFMTDAPAPAGPAQPAPDHPLDWMRAEMPAASWTAWIAPLSAVAVEGGIEITARTAFARDRVRNDHGRRLQQRYGAVTWQIARSDG